MKCSKIFDFLDADYAEKYSHKKASAFAKASDFACATPDKSADRLRHEEKLGTGYPDSFDRLRINNTDFLLPQRAPRTQRIFRFSVLDLVGKMGAAKFWVVCGLKVVYKNQ